MPVPEMDLKKELSDAGNRLLTPPDSLDELLPLLDRVEQCLSMVEQQPPEGMQDALCPSFTALVADELLKHPDIDVRVGVAACLTEISRITAPDVPYRDEMMKEIFRLTISAFEGLSDNSSKSFAKRVSILEIVARVRSCSVLLDLECEDLVIEMLNSFYKCIRDFHSVDVFASMECIMTLVVDESEEISTNLLLALLSVLRKENKDALPVAKRLGEKVVQNCAIKLKSCIVEAIKSLTINLLDYDVVVTKICQIAPDHNSVGDCLLNVPLVSRSDSAATPVEEVAQELVAETPPSPTFSIQRNGNIETAKEAAHGLLNTLSKPDSYTEVHPSKAIQDQFQDGHAALSSDMMMKPQSPSSKLELKPEKIAKKRGRKPKSAKETDSSKLPEPNSNKKTSELTMSRVDTGVKVRKAPPNESSVEPNMPERKSDSNDQPLSAKPAENKVASLGTPSLSDSPEKSPPIRIRRSKKPAQQATPSQKNTENNVCDGPTATERRLVSSEKGTPDMVVGEGSKLVSLTEVKKEQDIGGDSGNNPLKNSGDSDETPRTKKRGRPRKDAPISAAVGFKDGVSPESTSKKRSRNRFTQPDDGKEYGEELVGSRIKVWWPQDKVYYDGIIESFDSVKKRHEILYTDNEREVLNLRKQKWKLVKSGAGSEKDGGSHPTDAAGDSSDKQQIKRLKTNSVSAGVLGNSDSPLKKRRGRPPKNSAGLANNDSTTKGSKPEDETRANESKIVSMDDSGDRVKSIDPVTKPGAFPDLNAELENSDHAVPENGDTQANQNASVTTAVMDTTSSKTETGFDINEKISIGSDEKYDADETAALKRGNSNVSVAKESNSDPCAGPATEEASQKLSASCTEAKPRKRKSKTSSNSSSPAVPGRNDLSVKRRPGRPSKISLGTSDLKSKGLSKQLGEPKVDDSRCVGLDALAEGLNVPDMSVGLKVSEHDVLDGNLIKPTPESTGMSTKDDIALPQTSVELKRGLSTGVKIKSETPDSEPRLRKKKSRKSTRFLSGSEQVNKDGSVKSPSVPPCKPNTEVPKPDSMPEGSRPRAAGQHKADDSDKAIESNSEIIHKAKVCIGNGSGSIFKKDAPDAINVPQDPMSADDDLKGKEGSLKIADHLDTPSSKDNDVAYKPGGLKVSFATETEAQNMIGKSSESRTTDGNMAISGSSSMEQFTESHTVHEGEGKSRKTRSKKAKGGEVFFS